MTASSANSLSRKDGNVLFTLVFDFVFITISFQPFWMTTVNMSFGRQAYMTLLTVWYYCFIFSDNFVPDKLPKLYKIFVQKQSITCMKIYMYVIYYFFNA